MSSSTSLRTLFALGALSTLGLTLSAEDIIVQPGESIQAAIDGAVSGDRILIQAGTYTETVDFGGKSLALIGSAGAAATILNGGGAAPVVRFSGGEGPAAQLVGLTVTGGAAAFGAGGIAIATGESPLIADCVIHNNSGRIGAGIGGGSPLILRSSIYDNTSSLNHGGGISGAPTMKECVIASNTCTSADGGGLYLVGLPNTSVLIEDCVIVENAAALTGSSGGGVYVDSTVQATFRRCVIANNFATGGVFTGVGGGLYFEASGTVEECVVYGNNLSGSSLLGGGIYGPATISNSIVWANSSPALSNNGSVTYSDTQDGITGQGNFSADPLFLNQFTGEFHLSATSPCIDAGDPNLSDPDGSPLDLGPYPFATFFARDNAASGSWTDPSFSTISATTGGRQVLEINLGAANAGESYGVLGSVSGTSPGFSIFGTSIPLVFDDYTLTTIIAPGATPLIGSFGVLGAGGEAEIDLVIPAGSLDLVGLTAWHAAVHGSFGAPIQIASTNAVSVTIE